MYFFLNGPAGELPAILKRGEYQDRQNTNTKKKQNPQRVKGEKYTQECQSKP